MRPMFACCLAGWSISRLFLDVQNRGYFCHLAGFLYVCLFLALPIISLNLFTAEPEVSDSHLFKLLPWKPLSHVAFFYDAIKRQGETLSVPRAFSLRHVIRLILMCLILIVIYWVTWFFQIRNIPEFRNVQILTFFWNQDVTRFFVRVKIQILQWLNGESDGVSLIKNTTDLFMTIIFEIFVFVLCVMLLNRNSNILHNFHQSNMKGLLLSFGVILLLTVSF